ncbi:MAG: serine hydrolase, partial [Muribaculaceae bacterium]|nr:serine hydrolase [Muribaculaceae bacterium]
IDTVMQRIYDIPLRPSNAYNYSCLNFALLMDIEQRLTGVPHQEFVANRIFQPLNMAHTGYRPLTFTSKSKIAPTENDKFLRRQTVHGFAHDELAAMSGGVQGNAGLFSNASDLAKLCQMWLNGGEYGGETVLSRNTVDLFTTSKSPTCRRGLGFDKPDTVNPDNSPTTSLAHPSVYGHLGFTGNCFWVDPTNRLVFIFLTNRVNPSRDNAAFNSLNPRPRLLEQVYNSL